MRRRSRQGEPAQQQSGSDLAEMDKAQLQLQAALDPTLIERFEKSLSLSVPVVSLTSRSSSDSGDDTSRTKGVPVRVGREFTADSTFKELPTVQIPKQVFISLPLPPEVSRVEPLQQLCVQRVATIMAQWTGHEKADQNNFVCASRVAVLPLGLKERLLNTLTCRLALTNFSLRPLLAASLRSLDISYCSALNDSTLSELLASCPALESVSIRGLKLSQDAVLRFLSDAPALLRINLQGVRGLESAKILEAASKRRHLIECQL